MRRDGNGGASSTARARKERKKERGDNIGEVTFDHAQITMIYRTVKQNLEKLRCEWNGGVDFKPREIKIIQVVSEAILNLPRRL